MLIISAPSAAPAQNLSASVGPGAARSLDKNDVILPAPREAAILEEWTFDSAGTCVLYGWTGAGYTRKMVLLK